MYTLVLEASQRMRAQGMRMTAQRRLILSTLSGLDTHPTAEELFRITHQQDPSLNLSTVYRALHWLETEGLVQSRRFRGERRQERYDSVLQGEHYHFYCTSCQTVTEFNTMLVNAIKAQFELHSGAAIDYGSVVLYGRCAQCRASNEQSA